MKKQYVMPQVVVATFTEEESLLMGSVDSNVQVSVFEEDAEEEAWARIRSQMPLSEKVVKADVCIDNDGSVEQTRSAVYELWKERVHE